MGKRIEDLSVYGSYDLDKMLGDIFEVSKNSGTSGSPIYASDGSRKIKLAEWINLIAVSRNFVPMVGPNYLFVDNSGTSLQSGTKLLAAIDAANAATPNGNPKSETNRFTILLLPGVYAMNTVMINSLGEFVDIVGIGAAKDIVITCSNSAGTIKIGNTNNYILKNLAIYNTSTGGSIIHNAGQTDNGIWDNLILTAKNTENTIFAGKYISITGTADMILNGSISGTVSNSTFANKSCGYSESNDIELAGTFINCTGGTHCFGGCSSGVIDILLSGTFVTCKATNGFGYNVTGIPTGSSTISGTMFDCRLTDRGFGYAAGAVVILGKIYNCHAPSYSFGHSEGTGGVTISGYMKDCTSGQLSFGYSAYGVTFTNTALIEDCECTGDGAFCGSAGGYDVTMDGIIKNCIGLNNSFASSDGTTTMGGLIEGCTALDKAFGYGFVASSVSGKIKNCDATTNSFGSTTAAGKLINCTRTGAYGVHLGTIKGGDYADNSAGNALTVGAGAIVKYSTIYQAGAGKTISAGGAVAASIYLCAMNIALDAGVITNNIGTPNNVVDTDIII